MKKSQASNDCSGKEGVRKPSVDVVDAGGSFFSELQQKANDVFAKKTAEKCRFAISSGIDVDGHTHALYLVVAPNDLGIDNHADFQQLWRQVKSLVPQSCENVSPGSFVVTGKTDIGDLFRDMVGRGFHWDKKMQGYVDHTLLNRLQSENTVAAQPLNTVASQPSKGFKK